METESEIRRRRFIFYGSAERRSLQILRKKKSLSWERIKSYGYIIAILLLLLALYFFLHAALRLEADVETNHKQFSFSEAAPQESEHSSENFSNRYSKDALLSKPKARFKFNEQVGYLLV